MTAATVGPRLRAAVRAVLGFWRYLYGENPLHLLSVLACFALSGYVVSRLWDDPSLIALGIWFAGAVLAHDLLLYPLYALADQPLVIARWARRRVLPNRPPAVPAINHIRLPLLGSMVLGIVWFPSITGRGAEDFEFTAGHPMVGQFDNWLLITGVLFLGSAVIYALRLGAAAGRGLVARLRQPGAAPESATEDEETAEEPQGPTEPETDALPTEHGARTANDTETEPIAAARPADGSPER